MLQLHSFLSRGAELNCPVKAKPAHLRGLVHFFVDLLHRQLDVELDAVQDVLEIRLLVHLKLQKHRHDSRVCDVLQV